MNSPRISTTREDGRTRGPRVVFITRRFWPHWDGASRSIGRLAAALVERGWQATVIVPLECPAWPATIHWRGVSVVRLPFEWTHRRAEPRYSRRLGRWLSENRGNYDLVCVSGLRDDACTALEAVNRDAAVVLRAESAGRRGDCLWQLDAPRKIKKQCMKAAAWIGVSLAAHRELLAAGYPRDRVYYIPHGVAVLPERKPTEQGLARDALAADNRALELPGAASLAVHVGRLERDRSLLTLLDAWQELSADRPDARLWLVGDGSHRSSIEEQLSLRFLNDRVLLVGSFDEVDVLLSAADAFVSPAAEEDLSVALLEALAAGLPVVVADAAGNREIIENEQHGLVVAPGDAEALAAALLRVFDQPDLAARLASDGRTRVENHFSLAKMVRSHIVLFENLFSSAREKAS